MSNAIALTDEWQYVVELIGLKALTVDNSYQRPPQPVFVEKLITEFDESLVGVLDVSHRKNGVYAILDGRQRFEALKKWKSTVWCAVYSGLTVAEEAMYFYQKNKNRRSVHPYYQLRALIVTGDKDAIAIDKIVNESGFKLEVGARPDHHLTAVRAVESVYHMSALHRRESLTPTLRVLRDAFMGRKAGKEGGLIRGFGKFFQSFPDEEIDYEWLIERMAGQNPQVMLGRADDKAAVSRQNIAYYIARDVTEIYNRNRPAGKRLSLRFITGAK